MRSRGTWCSTSPTFAAFLDVRPLIKGHTLLVPRTHVVTLPDLPADQRDGFLAAAQRLATAMVDGLGAQGSFVAMNNVVSQSVAHLHCHVVPAHQGGRAARLLLAAHEVRRGRGRGVRAPAARRRIGPRATRVTPVSRTLAAAAAALLLLLTGCSSDSGDAGVRRGSGELHERRGATSTRSPAPA